MAIDIDHMPSEGPPLFDERLGVQNVLHPAILLLAVSIDNCGEVVYLVMGRKHCGLPDLALINFPIPRQDIDPIVLVIHASGGGHPDPDRQPLAQRACGGLDTPHPLTLRMSLERAVQLSEGHELLGWKISAAGHDRV